MNELAPLKNWLAQQAATGKKTAKQGTGFSVLLTGEGNKLEAVESLAAEAGREVHRVDLSRIVSKYIGETEKNLEALFTEAAEKGWVLFFDEADALFGKRTSVEEAHDKYANQEVSYLLQLIEAYQGAAVVAISRKVNIDEAFLRRFRNVIRFPAV